MNGRPLTAFTVQKETVGNVQQSRHTAQHYLPTKILEFAAFPFDFDANVSIAVVIELRLMSAFHNIPVIGTREADPQKQS